ncbi:N-acetylglucosamine-6-phosphate deacetylase [Streptomyces californicus]
MDDRVGSLEPGKDADLVVLDEDFVLKGVRPGRICGQPKTA